MAQRSKFGTTGAPTRINYKFGPQAPPMEDQMALRGVQQQLAQSGQPPNGEAENALLMQQGDAQRAKEHTEDPFKYNNIGGPQFQDWNHFFDVLKARAPGGFKGKGGRDPLAGLGSSMGGSGIAADPMSTFNLSPDVPGNVGRIQQQSGLDRDTVINGLRGATNNILGQYR